MNTYRITTRCSDSSLRRMLTKQSCPTAATTVKNGAFDITGNVSAGMMFSALGYEATGFYHHAGSQEFIVTTFDGRTVKSQPLVA